MRYTRILSLLATAAFCSCLLTGPVQRAVITSAQPGEVTVSGEPSQRIAASLRALKARVRDPQALFDDTLHCPAGRAGDALLGMVLMSRAAGEGREGADAIYKAITANLNPAGYLGKILYGTADEHQFAGHGILLRGLCEYYAWTGESTVLDMAQVICDSLYVPLTGMIDSYPLYPSQSILQDEGEDNTYGVDPGNIAAFPDSTIIYTTVVDGWQLSPEGPGAVFYALEGLAHFYSFRKSDRCRDVIDELVSLFDRAADDPAGLASAPFIAGIKGLLRYGQARGTTEFTNNAENAWGKVKASARNGFHSVTPVIGDTVLAGSPSAASSAYIAAMWLWSLNGNVDHLEDAERIYYNALMPAQTLEGSFAYIFAADSTGKLRRCEADSCGFNRDWVEALAAAPRYSCYTTDNKILVPFYSAGEVILPEKGVRIVVTTDYPSGRTIRMELAEAPKRGIGLQVHFPSYMTMKSMTLNGTSTISGTVNSIGLLEFRDVFRRGDVIEMNYSFGARWTEIEGPDKDMYRAVYGPLVLGYHADRAVWLERGVALREDGTNGYTLDPEFGYRRDTVTGLIQVLNAIGGSDVSGTEDYEPPLYKALYRPLSAQARTDIFPEYVLTRIGKE